MIPNIIKKNFVPKDSIVNYNNILKGINEYPVYMLEEIILPLFGIKIHIVPSDFPITQSGILGSFLQTDFLEN